MIITRFLLHREGDEEKKDALQATTELWPLPQGPETSGPALLTRDDNYPEGTPTLPRTGRSVERKSSESL